MDLILWRHADAGEPLAGAADLQRALTPKGRRQAARMARWLGEVLCRDARILVSPALRTRQTARALERAFEVIEAIGPTASVQDLLTAAGWPDATTPVLLVGHQPVLGCVAAHLLAGVDQSWSIKKGSVWWLRLQPGSGRSAVLLRAVRQPEKDR